LNASKTKVKKSAIIQGESGLLIDPACVMASRLSVKFQAMFIRSKNILNHQLSQGRRETAEHSCATFLSPKDGNASPTGRLPIGSAFNEHSARLGSWEPLCLEAQECVKPL
jgi:hypothetical protein